MRRHVADFCSAVDSVELAASLFSQSLFEQVVLHADVCKHPLQASVLLGHGARHCPRTNGGQGSLSEIRLASIPPYFARHLYSVALLIPCSRHNSAAGTPPSIWRSTPMICASVNRVFFIGISSFILPRKFYFRIPLRSGGITRINIPFIQGRGRSSGGRASGTKRS